MYVYCYPSVSINTGDWFQDPLQIPKFTDAEVPYSQPSVFMDVELMDMKCVFVCVYLYITIYTQIHCCYYFEEIVIRSIMSKKNKCFYFTFTYSFSDALFLYVDLSFIIFLLTEDFFYHFLQVQSTSNRLPKFSLGKVLIYPSILKDNFGRYRIQVGGFFFLVAYKIFHFTLCLLAWFLKRKRCNSYLYSFIGKASFPHPQLLLEFFLFFY